MKKKTYILPQTKVIWYGLDENFMGNVGGMDGTSNPANPNLPNDNWVKEDGGLDDDMWSENALPATGSLWDNVW